jgi:hypothetical protein
VIEKALGRYAGFEYARVTKAFGCGKGAAYGGNLGNLAVWAQPITLPW